MTVPFFDLKPQFAAIEKEIKDALEEVFRSQQFILGPQVERLEQAIAQYSQTRYAIGVASGSDALLVSLLALGIGPGDEVIIPTFTFFATAGSVSILGATPVFVDIDPKTYNIDPHQIGAKITSKTKAIIPVHLYGQCADMDPILDLAKAKGLFVIEDAAQALGAEYRPDGKSPSRRAGQMGLLGCFSFFPTKNLGAFGDAGMIVTDNPQLAERIRVLRVHGSQPKYFHKWVGINSRLDAIQGAVLLAKFRHLEEWTTERQRKAHRYREQFEDLTNVLPHFELPTIQYSNRHIFNQFVIRVPKRDGLRKYLQQEGIGTEIYYPLPLHVQECFATLKHQRGDFPVSERAADETLALPIYPEMTDAQQAYVVSRIRNFYEKVGPESETLSGDPESPRGIP